jgi:glutamate carboxypeptidase
MKQLLSYLQQELPGGLQLLEQMVNMESPSSDKVLVDRFARFVGSQFEKIGGAVDYIPVERFGDHLRVKFPGKTSKQILLLGHTDTVFSVGEVAKRPFQITNGTATGPGVFDMKAGILIMWSALRALRNISDPLEHAVTVLLTSDEEVGSTSSRTLLESEALSALAVFVLEPSLPGGVLKTSRKGVGRFTVKAVGRAAHAGVDPAKGINAIEEIARQVLSLQSMSNAGLGTSVTVGVIQGGTRSNVVPAEAEVEVDVRVASNDEALRMTKALRGLQPQLPGARLEIRGAINRPPMERSTNTVRLFELARSIGTGLGIDIDEGSTGGASDGNFTAALGIPTLDGLGAVGDGAHSIDEYVEIASLPMRAALLAGLIQRIH